MHLGSALVDELGDIGCRLIEGVKWHSHQHMLGLVSPLDSSLMCLKRSACALTRVVDIEMLQEQFLRLMKTLAAVT